jgi:LuxR family maltose regulon positive regulatory protein
MGTVAALNALVHTEHGWTFDASLLAVAGTHEIGTGMAFLLEHLPPHVHVVISTRADPDLPQSLWRLRGELFEIRAADLRFTADEAAAYLNEAAELNLAAGDVAALEERTEG